MNFWLELDNYLSVVQLVRAQHMNRRAAGSIPVRMLIVAFSQLLLDRSNKCIKITLEISIKDPSTISYVERDAKNADTLVNVKFWMRFVCASV